MSAKAESLIHVPIRAIKVVVDVEDIFSPELTLEDFVKLHGRIPEPPKYRVLNIELVTCSEDNQPVLVTECGRCPKFVRRFNGHISCKKFSAVE
jgi:hypothetical protein